MTSPLTVALRSEVDALSYPDRMALLARRARAWSAAGDIDEVLDALATGGRFERLAGLFMATVLRRGERIESALADPDWPVRHQAITAWLATPDVTVADIGRLLDDASAQTRSLVYRLVRATGQVRVAEALIEDVRARFGDREAARLLSACGPEMVARLIPELGHDVANWSALARRHPQVVLDDAARQLGELTRPRATAWWGRYDAGVFVAGQARPHQLLELLERFAPTGYLPGDLRAYGVLADADPTRVLQLLTAPGRAGWLVQTRLPRALLDRFGRLDPAGLVELAARLRDQETLLAALLRAVPPRHRVELFDAAFAGVDRSRAVPGDVLLDVLPRARRATEADRILSLAAIRDNEALSLRYTAYLGWTRAEPALTAAIRRPRPDDRAIGYELLIACAARTADPSTVAGVVESLRRLRNEQDPVRSRALAALAGVPPGLIAAETAGALDAIASDAMQTRDSSSVTLTAVGRLAVRVLGHHFGTPPLLDWALRCLDGLFGGNRLPGLGRLDAQLRRGQEHEVFAALGPWLRAGVDHARYEPLFAVTRALGRRAWSVDELQAMLGQAIRPGNVSPVMRQAISLWLADPAHRSARVEHVLRIDSSTVTLTEVWQTICRTRTDLLDVVLTAEPPAGRFLAAGIRWVPTGASYVHRWLPRQQQDYAHLLERLAADRGVDIHTRAAAIASAARIAGSGWAFVHRYLDSPNVNLAEAALGALPWTDQPDRALPILLAHADDDRARVATYAAGRAAGFVAPSQLHTLLAAYPLARGKVTSRKEAIRLLSRLAVPGATAVLDAAWRQADQHRDVRTAIVSAARQRLDDPAVWPILTEAADGRRDEALALLDGDPFTVADRYRRRYAELVVHACRHPDREVARAGWAVYPVWAQWTAGTSDDVVHRLTDLDDRLVWRVVVSAVVALVDAGIGQTTAADVLNGLSQVDSRDPTRDDPQRDRPARRRIDALVDQLVGWARRVGSDTDRTALAAAGRLLAQHQDFVPQAGLLLVHGVPLGAGDPDTITTGMVEVLELVAQWPATAAGLAGQLGQRLAQEPRPVPVAIEAVADQLLARGDLAAGLFAAALAGYGAEYGWPPAWRQLVLRLRSHPVADVRAAGFDLTVAVE